MQLWDCTGTGNQIKDTGTVKSLTITPIKINTMNFQKGTRAQSVSISSETEIKILTLTRFLSPFLLSSTTTDNLPIYTQATEAAFLLFQTLPPWKTSIFLTWVYSKTLLRHHLATQSTAQAQCLGNTCAHNICVFLGARPAGLFSRYNPALPGK